MRYEQPVKSEWAQSLSEDYITRMGDVIADLTKEWFSEVDRAEGFDQYLRSCYVYGRMDQCATSVLPWVEAAIQNFPDLTVLEVGCGNGASTAPIAMRAKRVAAFDIDQKAIEAKRKRCELLNISNVDIFYRDTTWIEKYGADPSALTEYKPDVIFCYALLEHLTPTERVKFLSAAWNHLDVGGHLIVVECPNRLHWFDWHSSLLPFSDWLPDELAMLWYARSDRSNIWANVKADTIADLSGRDMSQLYRFGRGASYHEFLLAIGLDRMVVTAGPYSKNAISRVLPGTDPAWEHLLKQKLAAMDPPVPREFAAPCLDLVLTKTT